MTLRRAVEAALPFVETSFPRQPNVEAGLRTTLGVAFDHLGEPAKAAEQFEKARALYTRHLGPEHPLTLTSIGNLATCFADLGRHADALQLREQTLALLKVKLGPEHPDTLWGMHGLANSYRDVRRYAEALRLNEQALALRKATLGADHPDTLSSMVDVANGYEDDGRLADALGLREATLTLLKVKVGVDHSTTLMGMNNLAATYGRLGRHADALKLHEETLALQRAKFGPDHPDTLMSMNNIALTFLHLGRHGKALELFEETVRLYTAKFGPDHPDTLESRTNLAVQYSLLGRHADALKLEQETLALQKAKLGPDHPDTLLSMSNLAWSLSDLDRGAEAVLIADECLRRAEGTIFEPRVAKSLIRVRGRHFQKVKDAAGCRATAEMWEKLKRTDPGSLYDAACFRAVTAEVIGQDPTTPAADVTRLAGEEADRAMAWLEQAVAAGYSDVEHMKTRDADLHVLRERADFQKLVVETERKRSAAAELALEESARLLREQPGNPTLLASHAAMLMQLNRHGEAEAAHRAAIRVSPQDASLHHGLGDLLLRRGQLAEAADEYAESVRLRPDMHESHYGLSLSDARRGQWEKAKASLRRCVELSPRDHQSLLQWACLCLYTDDQESYRRACQTLVERFGDTTQLHIAERTAKTCSLGPGALDDFDPVLKLADWAVTGTEKDGLFRFFVLAKGLVECRVGRHASALDWLGRFGANARGNEYDATAFSVTALAHLGLGQREEASSALREAQLIIEAKSPDPANGRPYGDDWHDWIHAKILFREAEKMLAELASRP